MIDLEKNQDVGPNPLHDLGRRARLRARLGDVPPRQPCAVSTERSVEDGDADRAVDRRRGGRAGGLAEDGRRNAEDWQQQGGKALHLPFPSAVAS